MEGGGVGAIGAVMVVGLPLADELAAVFARANELLLTEVKVYAREAGTFNASTVGLMELFAAQASAMQQLLTESRRDRKPLREILAKLLSSTRIAGI